jgi:hypothetical protein
MHSLDANLKTHVQGKQVYVGSHHMVEILYCNQTSCVCVCVLPRPKVSSKTSFGVVHSFFLPKFRNSKLHSFVTCLRCPFSLVYVATSYGCCYFCCSCSIKVEKEEVAVTQEHKKPISKRNQRNSKLRKICHFQH